MICGAESGVPSMSLERTSEEAADDMPPLLSCSSPSPALSPHSNCQSLSVLRVRARAVEHHPFRRWPGIGLPSSVGCSTEPSDPAGAKGREPRRDLAVCNSLTTVGCHTDERSKAKARAGAWPRARAGIHVEWLIGGPTDAQLCPDVLGSRLSWAGNGPDSRGRLEAWETACPVLSAAAIAFPLGWLPRDGRGHGLGTRSPRQPPRAGRRRTQQDRPL